jgi:phosphate transport system permease protein
MAQARSGDAGQREAGFFPEGAAYDRFVKRRQGAGRFWHIAFLLATLAGVVALVTLLADISNDAFGYVAIEYQAQPAEVLAGYFEQHPPSAEVDPTAALAAQPSAVLLGVLEEHISAGRRRALDAQAPLAERSQAELAQLVETEVLKPEIVQTWPLFDSLFRRDAVQAEAAALGEQVDLQFRSWVNWNFVTSPQSSDPLKAGIATAIWGSLWVTLLAFLVAIPLGVAAAIYLEEYNTGQSRLDHLIETNINNLAGVPSIIYGMLGLAVFVRLLGPLTSGVLFGVADPTTANGRTIISAGLTLGVLILPLVIINAREAIRAVPRAMREGAYGLGATRWQTTWHHVLPSALPGILTGVILAVSRAFGETAPLIVVGVSTYIVVNPDSIFAKYTTLPAQIYQWVARPQEEFQHLAAAAIIVLLLLLIMLNAAAIWLRNRYSRRV